MPVEREHKIDEFKKEQLVESINDRSFFKDKEFELLSTIRYDPNLSKGTAKFNKLLNPEQSSGKMGDMLMFNENVDILDIISSGMPLEKEDQFIDLTKANEEELTEIYYYRFFLLGEHLKRLQFTMEYFGLGDYMITTKLLMDILLRAIPLEERTDENIIFEEAADDDEDDITISEIMTKLYSKKTCYKLRLLVNKRGDIRCEAYPITSKTSDEANYVVENLFSGFLDDLPTYKVYLYDTKISPSCFTSFKTTYREHYNKAREQMAKLHEGQSGPAEILLFNTAGELMEGSITNCYVKFHLEDKWFYITPTLSTGCLCGVMRNLLVTKGIVTELKRIDESQLVDGDEILLSNGIMGIFKGQIVKPANFEFKTLEL